MFISESHYLIGLLDTLQYDTIYHEHLRYYSLTSLANLLQMHGLEVFHARRDPDPRRLDPGLCRAAGRAARATTASPPCWPANRAARRCWRGSRRFAARGDARPSCGCYRMLRELKEAGARICGISAPSRASTLVNYVGLDEAIIDYVCEIAGSLKIGKCMPGHVRSRWSRRAACSPTSPTAPSVFSWHIADELAPKLRAKGYRGKLVTPLPVPREL